MLLFIGAVAAENWKCPGGWDYNPVTKECDSSKSKPSCSKGSSYDPRTKECVCPPDWAWDPINGCYVPGEFRMVLIEKKVSKRNCTDMIIIRLMPLPELFLIFLFRGVCIFLLLNDIQGLITHNNK